MRFMHHVLIAASAVFCLTAVAQGAPTIVVGNYAMQPNTVGWKIPIYVTGIEPNTVNGITFSVMINHGGPAYGGTPGPIITDMDFDTGPTIWGPTGHNTPTPFFDGQLASANFLTVANPPTNPGGFLPAGGGLVVTLTIDSTGFGAGVYHLQLFGTALEENVGNTDFIGQNFVSSITNGTITSVPEPSSVVLAAIGLIGLVVWKRRKR